MSSPRPKYVLSPSANADIEDVLRWTASAFGENARDRYEILIFQSLKDIVDDAHRIGSYAVEGLKSAARTYHVRFSRDRVSNRNERVHKPRHVLVYRTRQDDVVEIIRVLHERMDPDLHVQ